METSLARTVREFGGVNSQRHYAKDFIAPQVFRTDAKTGIILCFVGSHRLPAKPYSEPSSVNIHQTRIDESDPSKWVVRNFPNLLAKYPNEWIAIKEQTVVGHAKTAAVLIQRMAAKKIDRPFVTKVTRPSKAWATAFLTNGD